MRHAPILLAVAALFVAGCVEPPAQRWIVTVVGGDGATVEVPVPLSPDSAIPDFALEIRPIQGYGLHQFVESEKGPALRIQTFPNAPKELTLSARQTGVRPATLSLDAGNATYWMNSTAEGVVVGVILGDTTLPECPQHTLGHTFKQSGWARVPLKSGSRCPE